MDTTKITKPARKVLKVKHLANTWQKLKCSVMIDLDFLLIYQKSLQKEISISLV